MSVKKEIIKNSISFIRNFLKKKILKLFESSKMLSQMRQDYKEEAVLILGDGVSMIYAINNLSRYKYIICSNRSILNKQIQTDKLLHWVCMEPFLMGPYFKKKSLSRTNDLFREVFKNSNNIRPIVHPSGRIFDNNNWKKTNPIFLSPYHEFQLSSGDVFKYFGAAFQASVGAALLSGFKEIHCAGFDAWLLSPENHLRWYSGTNEMKKYDIYKKSYFDPEAEEFLKITARNSNLSVYTYKHYSSKYNFISSIKSDIDMDYIPKNDRSKYMHPRFLKTWREIESQIYPDGYMADRK